MTGLLMILICNLQFLMKLKKMKILFVQKVRNSSKHILADSIKKISTNNEKKQIETNLQNTAQKSTRSCESDLATFVVKVKFGNASKNYKNKQNYENKDPNIALSIELNKDKNINEGSLLTQKQFGQLTENLIKQIKEQLCVSTNETKQDTKEV
jgi:frataxin-like iron-binding protein CyaY